MQVVVVGAGQAGLSAAYHLARRGLRPGTDFVVLDANQGPGGAWRHRWDSLTFDAAHALHDLPGLPLSTPDPHEPASAVVARYYGRFEDHFGLAVERPVRVAGITRTGAGTGTDTGTSTQASAAAGTATAAADGLLVRATDGRTWSAQAVVNATGTWDRPYWPAYPGRPDFGGRQLHTHDFTDAADFAGERVLVVGGGTSAAQFLLQLDAAGASTVWSTRRAPDWTTTAFDAEWGRGVEDRVNARTRAGLPPRSVVSETGLPLTAQYLAGIDAGVLVSRGPLQRLVPGGAVFADGTSAELDTVLWATGFRAALDHLSPLRLREPGGGIRMAADSVTVVREPRLFLVGYGASASTLGATRAGRAAALAALRSVQSVASPAPREEQAREALALG